MSDDVDRRERVQTLGAQDLAGVGAERVRRRVDDERSAAATPRCVNVQVESAASASSRQVGDAAGAALDACRVGRRRSCSAACGVSVALFVVAVVA